MAEGRARSAGHGARRAAERFVAHDAAFDPAERRCAPCSRRVPGTPHQAAGKPGPPGGDRGLVRGRARQVSGRCAPAPGARLVCGGPRRHGRRCERLRLADHGGHGGERDGRRRGHQRHRPRGRRRDRARRRGCGRRSRERTRAPGGAAPPPQGARGYTQSADRMRARSGRGGSRDRSWPCGGGARSRRRCGHDRARRNRYRQYDVIIRLGVRVDRSGRRGSGRMRYGGRRSLVATQGPGGSRGARAARTRPARPGGRSRGRGRARNRGDGRVRPRGRAPAYPRGPRWFRVECRGPCRAGVRSGHHGLLARRAPFRGARCAPRARAPRARSPF